MYKGKEGFFVLARDDSLIFGWMDGWNVFWGDEFIDFFGWRDVLFCFGGMDSLIFRCLYFLICFIDGWFDFLMDGWMKCFFPLPREFGRISMAMSIIPKLLLRLLGCIHLIFSLFRPVSLLQVTIGILHTLVVKGGRKMKDLRKKTWKESKKGLRSWIE